MITSPIWKLLALTHVLRALLASSTASPLNSFSPGARYTRAFQRIRMNILYGLCVIFLAGIAVSCGGPQVTRRVDPKVAPQPGESVVVVLERLWASSIIVDKHKRNYTTDLIYHSLMFLDQSGCVSGAVLPYGEVVDFPIYYPRYQFIPPPPSPEQIAPAEGTLSSAWPYELLEARTMRSASTWPREVYFLEERWRCAIVKPGRYVYGQPFVARPAPRTPGGVRFSTFLCFEVPPDALVNLGVIHILHDDLITLGGHSVSRVHEASDLPISELAERFPEHYNAYKAKLCVVKDAPTVSHKFFD